MKSSCSPSKMSLLFRTSQTIDMSVIQPLFYFTANKFKHPESVGDHDDSVCPAVSTHVCVSVFSRVSFC